MAAAIGLLVPLPMPLIIISVTAAIFALQVWGSYTLIRNIFRWLSLTLRVYVGSAILAKPDLLEVIKGTLIPSVQFNERFSTYMVLAGDVFAVSASPATVNS